MKNLLWICAALMALFATGKMDQMLVQLYIFSLFKNVKMSSPKTVLSTNLLSPVVTSLNVSGYKQIYHTFN